MFLVNRTFFVFIYIFYNFYIFADDCYCVMLWPERCDFMDEAKLRSFGVGSIYTCRIPAWHKKRDECYKPCGVWLEFKSRRNRHVSLLMSAEGGMKRGQSTRAHESAQGDIDYKLLKAAGADVDERDLIEVEVSAKSAKTIVEPDELVARSDFGEVANATIDPIRDLNWIYNNLSVKDVPPSDAPSTGAYGHLKFIQRNPTNMVGFFERVYPRIIPSKSVIENQSKFNDDGREHFDLLDRLLAESEDGEDEIPPLRLGV